MKVIKKGALAGDSIYRTTCSNCKSELEFQRKEAKYHFDQRDGDFLEVKCPVCGHPAYANVKVDHDGPG